MPRSLIQFLVLMMYLPISVYSIETHGAIDAGGSSRTSAKIVFQRINYIGRTVFSGTVRRFSTSSLKKAPLGPDPAFKLGEVYTFPNPAKIGKTPVIHVEVGIADQVKLRIYDVSCEIVHQAELRSAPTIVNDGNGQEYAYEYAWLGTIPSGTYICKMTASKSGESDLTATTKIAVIR